MTKKPSMNNLVSSAETLLRRVIRGALACCGRNKPDEKPLEQSIAYVIRAYKRSHA